jgi:flagellar biosynthesis/type III secretory pathway ATPase
MKALAEQISDIDGVNIYGRVVGVRGLMVEIAGPIHAMSVGARIVIETGGNRFIPSEVIGFTGNNAVVMPFAGLEGVRRAVALSSPMPQARCGLRRCGLAASSTRWASRSTARGRCRKVHRRCPTAIRRRRRIRASASARRSISACGRSIRL